MFIVSFMCINFIQTLISIIFFFISDFQNCGEWRELESAIIQPSNVAEYSGKFVKMVYGVI